MGFSVIAGDPFGTVMRADNCSFDGTKRGGVISADGQLFIGNALSPHIRPGVLTSPGGTLTIGYSAPDITLDVDGGAVGQTLTGNVGGALSPVAGNWNLFGTATNGIETDSTGPNFIISMNSPFADSDFSFESQAGGTLRTLTVQNTVDAASSGALLQALVAGSASTGNPTIKAASTSQRAVGFFIDTATDGVFFQRSVAGSTTLSEEFLRVDGADGSPRAAFLGAGGVVVAGGGAGTLSLLHVANIDAAANSNAEILLQTGDPSVGAGGGSQWIRWGSENQAQFTMGQGKDASPTTQPLEIKNAPFVGGSVFQSITPSGEVTFPLTPAFLATHTVTQSNITGNGTLATINFTTEIFDQNGDYDGTNTFQAPVTGRYLFNCCVYTSGYVAATTYEMRFTTSNGVYRAYIVAPLTVAGPGPQMALPHSIFADMDAGDTCIVQITVSGEAGDIIDSNADGTLGYFGGSLQC